LVDPVTGDCHNRMSERMGGVAYLEIWAGSLTVNNRLPQLE
jgi:hypothetical protein